MHTPSSTVSGLLRRGAALAALAFVLACGGGSSSSSSTPSSCGSGACVAPAAPTGVTAVPANGAAALSWTASPGATSYRIYDSASPEVTAASSYVTVNAAQATVAALANGAPRYFAVSAVNATGESALSPVTCAVPTAADTAGLTLYDGLCGDMLDAARWPDQAGYGGARVTNGVAHLAVQAANQESRRVRGTHYTTSRTVVTRGSRVTTLSATVSVPEATASGEGTAEIRANLRLAYQPPALRAAGSKDHLDLTVGLIDKGAGLRVFRQSTHCDDDVCGASNATGISFSDPAGLTSLGEVQAGAPAAYDTPYTLTVSLDEGTGVFHWTIAGGAYGAGISGTADPSAYLASASGWSGVSLATGFNTAQLQVRTQDHSAAGGGSGAIVGTFDDVQVGLDGAAATPFDDFGGAGGNSGPLGLARTKWSPQGSRYMLIDEGSLLSGSYLESAGTTVRTASYHGLTLPNPSSIDTLQAEVSVPSSASSAGAAPTLISYLQGRFYRTATADVSAQLLLDARSGAVSFGIGRCNDATCSSQVAAGGGPLGTVSVTTPHALRIAWNPVARTFRFSVDQTSVTVDPQVAGGAMTEALPYAAAPASPQRAIMTGVVIPPGAPQGATAGFAMRVNNVFVKGSGSTAATGTAP